MRSPTASLKGKPEGGITMRQKLIEWIHDELTQERESYGGEFILMTISEKGTGSLIVEADAAKMAGWTGISDLILYLNLE
jgi:hypothetical protein